LNRTMFLGFDINSSGLEAVLLDGDDRLARGHRPVRLGARRDVECGLHGRRRGETFPPDAARAAPVGAASRCLQRRSANERLCRQFLRVA
jgi:hypothetical protein